MQKEDFNQLINSARQTDLLSYFQQSGYTVEKVSENYYIKEIKGLCIRPDTNQWYNHYTNTGRTNNSIDCLTLVLGRSFNQAVYELTGKDIANMRSSDYPKNLFMFIKIHSIIFSTSIE